MIVSLMQIIELFKKFLYHTSKFQIVSTGAESEIKTKPVLPNNVVVTNFTGLELIFDLPILPQSMVFCEWFLPGTQIHLDIFNYCFFQSSCSDSYGCYNDYYNLRCKERDNGTIGIVTFSRLSQSFLKPNQNYSVNLDCFTGFNFISQALFNFSVLGEY